MKKLLIIILLMAATAVPAWPYAKDTIFVQRAVTGDTADIIADAIGGELEEIIQQKFPCLNVTSIENVIATLNLGREQQLLGTPLEQQVKIEDVADTMGAKYLVIIQVTGLNNDKDWVISVRAYNRKKAEGIYNDIEKFSDPEEALTSATRIAEKLVKGFAEHLSMQKGGYGEICPFTGRVDVYREISRQRDLEEKNEQVYCNGHDQEWKEGEHFRSSIREVWSLERIGNPDTKGGVEAVIEEKTVREEVNPCYACGPGEIGRWVWNRTVAVSGAVNGLSDKSAGETIKNKDATIRLNFKKDGTYTVTVKAASAAGTQTKTVNESAVGVCNTFSRNPPPTGEPLRLGFEYTFGPFTGTPFDTTLTEQIELKLPPREIALDTTEETILRIDFVLERQGVK